MGLLGDVKHLILLYLASAMTLTALFTPQWKVAEMGSGDLLIKRKSGLFRYCVKDNCVDSTENDLKTVLIIVGTIMCVACTGIMTIHFLLTKCLNTHLEKVPYVVLYITIVGGGLLLLGCALFGFDKFGEHSYPGYSFGLCVAGAILLPFGGSVGYKN